MGFAQGAAAALYIALMLVIYFTEKLDNVIIEVVVYFTIFLFLASAIIAISNVQRAYDNTRFVLFVMLGTGLVALAIASYLVLDIHTAGHIRYTNVALFASMLIASAYAFSRAKRRIDITDKTSFGYVE
ncbi:MAG: hypothetical protein ACP5UH_02035 [Candidatus Micrarchaeia archaeon]